MHPGPALAALAGLLTAVGPYVYSFGLGLGVSHGTPWQGWALLTGCIALLLGGLTMNARRAWDQAIVAAGVLAILAALAPELTTRPALALTVLLLAAALIFAALESDLPLPVRARETIPTRRGLAGTAARVAAVTAVVGEVTLLFNGTAELLERYLGATIVIALLLRWARLARPNETKRATATVVAAVAAIALLFAGRLTSAHLLLVVTALTLIPNSENRRMARSILGSIVQHPAGPLVTSFFLLCTAGAVVLRLPGITTLENGISGMDALFTSVSAVCVTGLIVLDTPNDFTLAGQAVILILIQLGALGIMSYSAAIILALGRRLRLRDEGLLVASLNASDRTELRVVLARLLKFTFVSEALGAMLLTGLFMAAGDQAPQAIWRGLFTSISAFCNAGFALQTDSLIGYQHNPWVLHVVGGLIVLGGLSPAAALAIPAVLRKRERRAQIKIALTVTAILLVANFVFIAAFEWNGALAGLSWADHIHNAWFQSITLRTAGFNSIEFGALRSETLLIMMMSMFIGGSPGGTAGGIKTTTLAVLVLSIVGAIRGGRGISVFGRSVSTTTVDRAAAIATLGTLALFVSVLTLLLTQTMPASWTVFESVSAMATVGLSIGGTGVLDSVGKLIIAFSMFAGRVGPLSLFAFLATRESGDSVQYPVEPIDVG